MATAGGTSGYPTDFVSGRLWPQQDGIQDSLRSSIVGCLWP